jgi:hypothetical protein
MSQPLWESSRQRCLEKEHDFVLVGVTMRGNIGQLRSLNKTRCSRPSHDKSFQYLIFKNSNRHRDKDCQLLKQENRKIWGRNDLMAKPPLDELM